MEVDGVSLLSTRCLSLFVRWLFYVEGSVTVIVAICAMFILPDFPATSSGWLTAEEQDLSRIRLEEEVGGGDEEEIEDYTGEKPGLKQALVDWKVWWLALALTSMSTILSFSSFFPTLTATLGYSSTVSLLLCTPPWLFATYATFMMSR